MLRCHYLERVWVISVTPDAVHGLFKIFWNCTEGNSHCRNHFGCLLPPTFNLYLCCYIIKWNNKILLFWFCYSFHFIILNTWCCYFNYFETIGIVFLSSCLKLYLLYCVLKVQQFVIGTPETLSWNSCCSKQQQAPFSGAELLQFAPG